MSTLTITTIQADLVWEDKAVNLRRFEEKIGNIRENTEVVILPEMFSTGFSMRPETLAEPMNGPTLAWMKKMAAQKRAVLTGSMIIEEKGNYYNRLIWMLPNGSFGYYDKRHRFAYAGENEHYTAGHKRLIASVKGWRINLMVCYDLRFPVWSRQTQGAEPALRNGPEHHTPSAVPPAALPEMTSSLEYDLLLYVANWPERRSHAWKTLLQARAIENQAYVIGVNRVGIDGNNILHSGDSLIVDPLGEVLHQDSGEEAVYTHTFRKEDLEEIRTRFPFWQDADHFSIEP
ncbi:nitrilase family protein [Flavitalea flava]